MVEHGEPELALVVPEEEARNPDLTEEELRAQYDGWLGANPYNLMIVLDSGRIAEIDLDKQKWMEWYSEFLRAPGTWYLVRKADKVIVTMMLVKDGEQPYYVARHVGFLNSNANTETINYGIGKKRLDGHVDRIWVMSNGCMVMGDDGEAIALDLLKSGML